MKKIFVLFILTSLITVVSACSKKTKENLGFERKEPDVSQAYLKDPLILPPNYHLRPVVPIEKADNNSEKVQ